MKVKNIILFLLFLFLGATIYAQNTVVRGKVLDENGEPLVGATVQETGNKANGTIVDVNGDFVLKVKSLNGKLTVSYVGYHTLEESMGNRSFIKLVLAPDSKGLDEVVILGYGQQKRITMTGAASSIKAEEIKRVPVGSINNVLAGRLPGFFSVQRSGQPGADAADFFIRGSNSLNGDRKPLIIVDDIEYSYEQLAQISANEIESITILKDASTTAVYGLKGANGVLVIKTTRGQEGKPTINFTAEGGINRAIKMPTILDAYTTASLYNEAQLNDAYGLSEQPVLQFSPSDLEFYRNGLDPYGHPNVDWVNTVLAKQSSSARFSIDIRGGNKFVKYFTSLAYYTQGGMMKHYAPIQPGEDVDNNYYYRRYNFRSNLDFTPTKTTSIRLDLNGRFETQNTPAGSVKGSLFDEIKNYSILTPYAMPLTLPNGKPSYATHPGVDTSNPVNPIARYANCGYKRYYKNNFNVLLSAEQKLDFITEGLSAMATVSYAGNFNERRELTRSVDLPAYLYDPDNNSYIARGGGSKKFPTYSLGGNDDTFNYKVTYQGRLNYDHTFNATHHLYMLYLISRQSYINQKNLSDNDQSMTWRLGYDFKHRYMVEFNVAYNGNDRFVGKKKFGWFPAVSVGWNLSEETFFKSAFPFFDLFKLRASYGLVGSDNSFGKDKNTTDVIWKGGGNPWGNTTTEGELVYVDATWEKERKLDVGLDMNMIDGRLRFTIDYFRNQRYDQLIASGDIPAIIGQTLPKRNIGKSENSGFDGELNYRGSIGDFSYNVGTTFSYAKNKVVYVSEAPAYPYQAQTGHRIGTKLGLKCVGFYQQEDFDENGKLKEGIPAPAWASNLQPGDLRYADLNGDNFITDADKTYISKPDTPTCTYGITLGGSWKGLSFNMLWQGAFDYAIPNMGGNLIPFVNNMQELMLERWTPQNTNARFPRLGITTWENNNYNTHLSDFWYLDASYIRLRSAEIAYQLPQDWLRKTTKDIVKAVRLYVTGYNLLNFSNLTKLSMDPENTSSSVYPTQASYMFGVQCAF